MLPYISEKYLYSFDLSVFDRHKLKLNGSNTERFSEEKNYISLKKKDNSHKKKISLQLDISNQNSNELASISKENYQI